MSTHQQNRNRSGPLVAAGGFDILWFLAGNLFHVAPAVRAAGVVIGVLVHSCARVLVHLGAHQQNRNRSGPLMAAGPGQTL